MSWVHLTKSQRCRLLYCNPVCLLGTVDDSYEPNVMVISWLTPVNDVDTFLISLNAKRRTSASMHIGSTFSLSVVPGDSNEPVDLVLQVGSLHGPTEKAQLIADMCGPYMNDPSQACNGGDKLPFLSESPAHARCTIIDEWASGNTRLQSKRGDLQQRLLLCSLDDVAVRHDAWSGKTMQCKMLSFAGTKTFMQQVPLGESRACHDGELENE